MSKLIFKNNPCEEHYNVITDDDWCPICLLEHDKFLQEENNKLQEALQNMLNLIETYGNEKIKAHFNAIMKARKLLKE